MSRTFDDDTTAAPAHRESDVRYVGFREHGQVVVTTYPEGERLTPERGLQIVRHSPSGAVGYRGSGPAQLALAVLLDYLAEELDLERSEPVREVGQSVADLRD